MVDLAVGAGVLVVGLVLWARPATVGLVELIAPFAGRLAGLTGELAGRNAVREPKRTTVTAGSLALGLALVSTLAVLAASTKATLDDAASESLTADVLVLPLVGQTPMSAAVTDAVRDAEGVDAASPILFDAALIDDQPAFVTGVDPAAAPQVLVLDMQHGDVEALARGELLVAASIAQRTGLHEGQEVRALFAEAGVVELRDRRRLRRQHLRRLLPARRLAVRASSRARTGSGTSMPRLRRASTRSPSVTRSPHPCRTSPTPRR